MTKIYEESEVMILLVEDNPGDVLLAQEAIIDAKVKNSMIAVRDGVEALNFLKKQGDYVDAVRPDIILLDINMPRMNGHELLEIIKKDKSLKQIPVIMLTTSEEERDILKSYDLYANSYIVKPVDVDQFTEVIRSIEHFWFIISKLPPK